MRVGGEGARPLTEEADEADAGMGLELDEQVHIAVGCEITPQSRPEEGRAADLATPTKVSDRVFP